MNNHSAIITTLSKGISLLLHPLVMPLLATIVVVYGNATSVAYVPTLKPFVVWSVAGMTLATPIVFWLIVRFLGAKGGDRSDERKMRRMMLLATELCLVGCGSVFAKFAMLFVVRKVLYTAAVLVAVLWIMEWLWPLCHHSAAIGAVLSVEWVLLYVGNVGLLWPFIATILAAGVVCSARLVNAKQAPTHIYTGLAVGVVVGFATFILL
jgi:hypothetical protein